MSKIPVIFATALLSMNAIVASAAAASFNLSIGNLPSQIVQKVGCSGLCDSDEEGEAHVAGTLVSFGDDDDEAENCEEDEQELSGSATKAVKHIRKKTRIAPSSTVAKTELPRDSSTKPTAEVKALPPEKAESAENAQHNEKIESAAVIPADCKRFFPAVGMTLSMSCE